MTDIFREVEEDVRRERFEKLWKAYGNYMIAALVLLFAGIGGWQLWDRHEQQERAKVAASFIAAQRITNPQAAAGAFVDIARTAPKGYANVARLAEANAMSASGQQGSAIALYKQIAADDSGTIGMVARLRAAWALADSDNRADLADLLKPLDAPGARMRKKFWPMPTIAPWTQNRRWRNTRLSPSIRKRPTHCAIAPRRWPLS